MKFNEVIAEQDPWEPPVIRAGQVWKGPESGDLCMVANLLNDEFTLMDLETGTRYCTPMSIPELEQYLTGHAQDDAWIQVRGKITIKLADEI